MILLIGFIYLHKVIGCLIAFVFISKLVRLAIFFNLVVSTRYNCSFQSSWGDLVKVDVLASLGHKLKDVEKLLLAAMNKLL
jgi:hypothetical protein